VAGSSGEPAAVDRSQLWRSEPARTSLHTVISALRKAGIGKVTSARHLARITGVPFTEMTAIVHESATWADTREADERFTEVFLAPDA
jgi:hypothetical protein